MAEAARPYAFMDKNRVERFPRTEQGMRAYVCSLEMEFGVQQTREMFQNFFKVGENDSEEKYLSTLQKYFESMAQGAPILPELHQRRQRNLLNNLGKPITSDNEMIHKKIKEQVAQHYATKPELAEKGLYLAECDDESQPGQDSLRGQLLQPQNSVLNLKIEQDMSLVNVMQLFYQKYTLLYSSLDEEEKARSMKVQLKMKDGVFVSLTRKELDELATDYRSAMQSFVELQGHLSPEITALIQANKDFPTFVTAPIAITENRIRMKIGGLGSVTLKLCNSATDSQWAKEQMFPKAFLSVIRSVGGALRDEDELQKSLCKLHRQLLQLVTRAKAAASTAKPTS